MRDQPSRFESDPVGTTVDIFFGDSNPDKILEWLGYDEED